MAGSPTASTALALKPSRSQHLHRPGTGQGHKVVLGVQGGRGAGAKHPLCMGWVNPSCGRRVRRSQSWPQATTLDFVAVSKTRVSVILPSPGQGHYQPRPQFSETDKQKPSLCAHGEPEGGLWKDPSWVCARGPSCYMYLTTAKNTLFKTPVIAEHKHNKTEPKTESQTSHPECQGLQRVPQPGKASRKGQQSRSVLVAHKAPGCFRHFG